jgi:hypothetical protein
MDESEALAEMVKVTAAMPVATSSQKKILWFL